MNFIALTIAKQHLRIDHDDDLELIKLYLTAAESYTESVLGQSLQVGVKAWDETARAAIQTAILLMLSSLYESRSADQTQEQYQNRAYMALLTPYRKNMGI